MKKVITTTIVAGVALGGFLISPTNIEAAAWAKCKACHNFTSKKKIGPGLKDIIGRKAGSAIGFKYKFTKYGNDWTWDEAHLRKWMCSSKKAVREFTKNSKAKTKMPVQRICSDKKQEEVLEKLRSISSGEKA